MSAATCYLHLTNDSYMTSNESNNHYNFHVLTTNQITTKLTYQNQDQRPKYHHLTTLTKKKENLP